MKQSLLVHPSNNPTFNIGDYIQAIAAAQFFPSADFLYIDRENLVNYDGDDTAMIMNGWFMFSKNWPPSSKITPHYIAFHINSSADTVLLSEKSISHLKKYEPIGCRDLRTRDILIEKGVDAYFSGCLTLTLGQTYQNKGDGSGYYIVDPIIEPKKTISALLSYLWTGISKTKRILHIYNKAKNHSIMSFIKTIIFYNQYSKIISDEILLNAEYPSVYVKNNFANEREKFDCAKHFLECYSKAKLVITSRIHCQMPCIAMNTPVLFLKNTYDIKSSTCRFGGLINLYNTINYEKGDFSSEDIDLTRKINLNTKVVNKNNHQKIVEELKNSCIAFIKKSFSN